MTKTDDTASLIDFHTHSLLSDGVLLPSELVRRYEAAGFKAVAITDHVDSSNIDFIIAALKKVSIELNKYWRIIAVPGVELTHIPIEQFNELTAYARKNGAKIVIAHGESPVEPVIKGTNRAAIEAGVDILAHPGYISQSDAELAAEKKVFLEITTRKGHSAGNRHVFTTAKVARARLIINSDSHTPSDIPTRELFLNTSQLSGFIDEDLIEACNNSEDLLKAVRG